MKKILSLILSITILLGCTTGISASAADVQLTDAQEALSLLTYMGIAKNSDNLSSNITRADFAVAVAKAIKAQSSNGRQYYIDVDASSAAFESISALTELGYLSGGDNMSFRPYDNIRLAEAAKLVTAMVGYGPLCEAKGGYPGGYLQVASSLDIIDNISGEFITREQAYVMLMRAVNTPLYVPAAISDSGIKYVADEDSTILSLYHDIYYIENTVNAVGHISLTSTATLTEGQVLIGSKSLRTDEISQDMYDYLGMTVAGYYTESEGNDASLVVALPMGDDNNVLVVNKEELSTIEDDSGYYIFKYYNENNKYETIKVSKGCVVLKNGMSVTSDLFRELTISKGSYKFLDHNGDDKIDVLFVNEYYNLVAGFVDNKEGMVYIETEYDVRYHRGPIGSGGTVYDKYDPSLRVDLSEENGKIVKLKDAYGNLIKISNIAVSDVLSVYKSSDEKYIEVIKGNGNVTGTVSEITYPDSDTAQLTINEEVYDIPTDVIAKNDSVLSAGFTGTFWLDAFGEIAYFEESANTDIIFGYLVDIANSTKALDSNVYLKIYGMNDVLDIYTWDEKTVIDGRRFKDEETAYDNLSEHTKQVIRFSADENKVLTFLDTLESRSEEGENSLRETMPYGKYTLSSTTGSFSQTMVISSSTPLMVVANDELIDNGTYKEENFSATKRSALGLDRSHNVATYMTDADGVREELILTKTDSKVGGVTAFGPFMIDEIRNGINTEGDVVSNVRGYNNKRPSQYQTINDKVLSGYNLKKGDLVWFELNSNDKIVSVIDVLVDNEESLNYKIENSTGSVSQRFYSKEGSTPEKLTNSTVDKGFVVLYGYAGLIKDGVMKFAYTKEDCEAQNYVIARDVSGTPVVVYDKNYGKDGGIYWSTAEDIIDYKTDPDGCSAVIVFMKNYAVQRIYVYK